MSNWGTLDTVAALPSVERLIGSLTHAAGPAADDLSTAETVSIEAHDGGPGIELDRPFDPNTRGPDSDGDRLGFYFDTGRSVVE